MKTWKHFAVILAIFAVVLIGCSTHDGNGKPNDSEGNETPATFTVTFNADNGTENTTQTVTENSRVTEPIVPNKTNDLAGLYVGIPDNYTFNGWYYNGTKWDFNILVKENIILTAQWTNPGSIPIDIPNSYTGNILERAFSYAVANKTITEGFTLLLDDDVVSGKIGGTSGFTYKMTLIGIGKPRAITYNGSGYDLFSTSDSTLTIGANITLKSLPEINATLIDVGYNGNFTMLAGSKISNSYLAINIDGTNAHFNMEGGEITDSQFGVYNCNKFTMSGGKISGNNISDVMIVDVPVYDSSSILSGSSQIGILSLIADSDTNQAITITSGWSGTVNNLDLWGEYNTDLNTTISWWQNKAVIKAVDGYILTLPDIEKIQLGNFVTNTTPKTTQPINNTHKLELDIANNVVKLVSK